MVDDGDVVSPSGLEFAVPVKADTRHIREDGFWAEGELERRVGFKEPEEFG